MNYQMKQAELKSPQNRSLVNKPKSHVFPAHIYINILFMTNIITSRKSMQCIRKLLKIKSKLIVIPITSFVEYVFFFFFLFCSSKCCRQDQ
jgi:hypothetical protein